VANCGGYERPETVRMLDGLVDIWLPDYKYADETRARDYSAAPDYPAQALAAIDEMLRCAGPATLGGDGLMKSGVLIRHLLLPAALPASMRAVRVLWERYGDNVILSLMSQYTPMGEDARYPALSKRVNPRHYEALVDYAASLGVTRCYVQEESAADCAFIPSFEGEGVRTH
jgi:putative pyruvate formate lyase activating enzyme